MFCFIVLVKLSSLPVEIRAKVNPGQVRTRPRVKPSARKSVRPKEGNSGR